VLGDAASFASLTDRSVDVGSLLFRMWPILCKAECKPRDLHVVRKMLQDRYHVQLLHRPAINAGGSVDHVPFVRGIKSVTVKSGREVDGRV